MTQFSNSKTDQFACVLSQLSESLAQVDDMFTNEEGHIEINSVEDYLKLGSLGLTTVKDIYACYGKEVKINIPGVGGKLLNMLLELLLSLQTEQDVKTKTVSNAGTGGSDSDTVVATN